MEIKKMMVSDGYDGIKKTINEAWKLVNSSTEDKSLINIAANIARTAPEKNTYRQAVALANWVKNNIYYLPDPVGKEMIKEPFVTINDKYGDCDDHSILLASLSQSAGIPVRFKTVLTDLTEEEIESVNKGKQLPNKYNHIYPQLLIPIPDRMGAYKEKWMSMDTTEKQSYLGWDPPNILAEKIWENPAIKGLSGNWLAEQWEKLTEKGKENIQKQFDMTVTELFSQFTDKKATAPTMVSLPPPTPLPTQTPEVPWFSQYGKYIIWGIGGGIGLIAIISLLRKEKK